LAVACAVAAFREKTINRIILTRPAVEAGEKLGFLPGDLQNKVDPYLRPLYDALFDMLGAEAYQRYLERGNIEVAPLAYMRGRTLDDAFIILDEAQNTTPEQMKMFLTRIGFNSKAVITGDVTQIDLPDGKFSGLKDAMNVVQGIEDIGICHLNHQDVVRHELVSRIIMAYEKRDEQRQAGKKGGVKYGKAKG
jgi:phosphate starvation-inducible PhoH-like protein